MTASFGFAEGKTKKNKPKRHQTDIKLVVGDDFLTVHNIVTRPIGIPDLGSRIVSNSRYL